MREALNIINPRIDFDGLKYMIWPGKPVEKIVPFPLAGKLKYNGKEMIDDFDIGQGEMVEYYPFKRDGEFSWDLNVDDNGSKAVVKVRHIRPGSFVISSDVIWKKKWFLQAYVKWEENNFENIKEK